MPTYDYSCPQCGRHESVFQSISSYCEHPIRPRCHGAMERKLSVVPAMSGLANALAGDRHYAGLRAPDGSDISSRTKHREYMKRAGVTDIGDFTSTWAKQEQDRKELRNATFKDTELRADLTQQVMTAVAQPD